MIGYKWNAQKGEQDKEVGPAHYHEMCPLNAVDSSHDLYLGGNSTSFNVVWLTFVKIA